MEKSDPFRFTINMPVLYFREEVLILATEDISRPKANPTDPGQVGAPMSGVVIELRVHVGSTVKKGDPIAVLSAMYSVLSQLLIDRKMEMVISAPHSGKIEQIQVSEGVFHTIFRQTNAYRTRSLDRT
jgi:pyruvate carboxylase